MAKSTQSHISKALDVLPIELDVEQDTGAPSAMEPAAEAAVPTSPSLPATIRKVKVDFDFGEMPATDQAKIRRLENDLDETLTTAIIRMGEKLLAIRKIIEKHCPRGTWSQYLKTGLRFSESSARNYIRAAETSEALSATVAEKLPPTALYSARHAPDDVRQEIARRSNEGEVVSARDVERLIKAHPETQPDAEAVQTSRASNSESAPDPSSECQAAEDDTSTRMDPESMVSGAEALTDDPRVIAAKELIARLSAHFEPIEIRDINKLWQTAGFDGVNQQLNA